MLSRRQLEDAARCTIIDCAECSMYCINTIETTRRCGRAALAYRDMLKRLEWKGYDIIVEACCPICHNREEEGHEEGCELSALLKESEVEEE